MRRRGQPSLPMVADLPLDWVLEKTPKGRDELATRAGGLQPGQRNLLIMADGRRPVAELLKAGADPERCRLALEALIEDGFLQRVSGVGGDLPAAPVAPAAPAGAGQGRKHLLLIALAEELFGSQAPRLVQKIEQHPDTPEGHAAAVESCVKFVRLFIDERQAEVFAQRARSLLAD